MDVLESSFNTFQIQPANVSARNGYAKKGNGEEVGNTCSPQKILADVTANRVAPIMPAKRVQLANPWGMLVSRRAADHKAVARGKGRNACGKGSCGPDEHYAFPIAKMTKPAAARSFPFLKNFKASRR